MYLVDIVLHVLTVAASAISFSYRLTNALSLSDILFGTLRTFLKTEKNLKTNFIFLMLFLKKLCIANIVSEFKICTFFLKSFQCTYLDDKTTYYTKKLFKIVNGLCS